MSPGAPSRVAELGGDPHRLAEAFHRLLVRAEESIKVGSSAAGPLAAVMQAIAIQTLASNVGRLAEAIEADSERAPALPLPAAPVAFCPGCGHVRGFGAGCNFPDGGPGGPRCGCRASFHSDGAR